MWSKIRKIFRIVLLLAIVCAAAYFGYSWYTGERADDARKAAARANPAYLALKSSAAMDDDRSMMVRINGVIQNSKDPATAAAVVQYLDDDSFGHGDDGQLHPGYFLLLGDISIARANSDTQTVLKTLDYRKAFSALMTYESLIMADGARCDDKTAASTYLINVLGPRLAALKPGYLLIGESYYERVINEAIAFEIGHRARLRNVEVCTLPPADEATAAAGDEAAAAPDVKFVDDGLWDLRRGDVHEKLRGYWQERYKKITAENGNDLLQQAGQKQ
ncbi:MAG: hypothetical protein PW788_04980 [Micavibrio sp.]|nr:hypothetical protein [Micavibrio sp.]